STSNPPGAVPAATARRAPPSRNSARLFGLPLPGYGVCTACQAPPALWRSNTLVPSAVLNDSAANAAPPSGSPATTSGTKPPIASPACVSQRQPARAHRPHRCAGRRVDAPARSVVDEQSADVAADRGRVEQPPPGDDRL